MQANAAKFASIINNLPTNQQSKKLPKENKSGKNKLNGVVGVNLDQNRFSELANLDGRFWDLNSNANVNAKDNTNESKNTRPTKNSKNVSNLGPGYFLKTTTNPKTNFKSDSRTKKNLKKCVDTFKYDPKKDRQNVAFHKARKEAIEENLGIKFISPTVGVNDDGTCMIDNNDFFSPMPDTDESAKYIITN